MKAPENESWSGYTIDELRYRIGATREQIETQREIVEGDIDRLRRGNVFLSPTTFRSALSMVNYADFLVLGIKLIRRLTPLFRRGRQ